MALAERAALEQLERLVGQVEQAHQVRDRDAAAADAQPDLLARKAELLDERRTRSCLLDRVEVLTSHVLDQRELERLGVVARADERGDRVEAGELRGPPAALAGDQLETCRPASGRTRTGCSTPRVWIDAASAASASSSKCRRGWRGFGHDQVDRKPGAAPRARCRGRRDGEDRRQAASHAAVPRGRNSPRRRLILGRLQPSCERPHARARRRRRSRRSTGRGGSPARRSSAPR